MRMALYPMLALPMLVTCTAFGQARVIITEIMYNPASNERGGEAEWIEIANVGTESISIYEWRLDDEDRKKWGTFSCTLAPGAIAVLVNEAAVDEAQFRAAWDASESAHPASSAYLVLPIKWGSIANTPSATNEVIQLLNEKGDVVCEVKQGGADWPMVRGAGGQSVYLTDITATDLSDGKRWRISAAGKDGARACAVTKAFDQPDEGSPGFVPGLSTVLSSASQAAATPPAAPPPAATQPESAGESAPTTDIIEY